MTTEIGKTFTRDITQENETYNFCESLLSGVKVGASSWMLKTFKNKDEARLDVLNAIVGRISQADPKISFWCWLGDSVWQNDTKIIRYKRLWKRIKDRGIALPDAESFEKFLVNEGKLKFFGAFALTESSMKNAINLISLEKYVYVIALPSSVDIRETLNMYSDNFQLELLRIIANVNGYLCKAVGEFDDIETGFVVFSNPNHIENLR